MSLIGKILRIGTDKASNEEEKNSIIVTNGLNFIFALLTAPLIILFLFISPFISLLSLIPMTLYITGFWLVKRGHLLLARILLPVSILSSIFLIAGMVKDLELHIPGYRYLILVSVLIPFMIFQLREIKYTLIFLVITLLLLVFSEKILHLIHQLYSIQISPKTLMLIDKIILIEAFIALAAISFIYRKYVTLYFQRLQEHLEELKAYQQNLKQANDRLKYQNDLIKAIMDSANDAIIITQGADKIIVWNQKATEIFGYEPKEAQGKNPHQLLVLPEKAQKVKRYIELFHKTKHCDLIGKTLEGQAITKLRKIVDIELSISAIEINDQIYSLAIIRDITERKRNSELLLKKTKQLERLTKDLTDSIEYAKLIQTAVFQPQTSIHILNKYFRQHFIFLQPMQIVSGDFYYIRQTQRFVIVGIGDCTGHGIPGAFMTLITIAILNEIIGYRNQAMPHEILEKLSVHLRKALGTKVSKLTDTVEIALLMFDKKQQVFHFAGANLPAYLVRDQELIEIKPDKISVADRVKNRFSFTLHTVKLKQDDTIFLSTDGFYSQFGGPNNKKYSRKRFRQLLVQIAQMDFSIAKRRIEQEFFHWKQANDQTDDVLVLGLRI